MSFLTPAQLRGELAGEREAALVDVREEGDFADGHLLTATSVPLSRLELLMPDLVPRLATRVVVCGGDALIERAVAKLQELGYADIAVFPGDPEHWRSSGLEVFTGVHVPSKAFGEFVEHHYGTPDIAPEELKARTDAGDDVLVLDSRPMEEYQTRNIPGAIDVPGVELVARIKDLARAPSTLVVVNCGGRTRSIIGAQSLINAGVPNRVVALRNGTMGWHLAGYPLEHGQSRRAPAPSVSGMAWSKAATDKLARRYGVRRAERARLQQWARDTKRTLYIFDVRQPEEYAMGHFPGSRLVQGGQLVQETDRYIAVRNARIALVDDNCVRATVAGSWLRQMGYRDVYVVRDALAAGPLDTGPWRSKVSGLRVQSDRTVLAADLLAPGALDEVTVLDLGSSASYRRGHIPGAHHGIRAQLPASLAGLKASRHLVLTSEDGLVALLAVAEAACLTKVPVFALMGGNNAWHAAGGELERDGERWTVAPRDVWLKPFDQLQGRVEDRLKTYLNWEVGLLDQLSRDGSLTFRYAPRRGAPRVAGRPRTA